MSMIDELKELTESLIEEETSDGGRLQDRVNPIDPAEKMSIFEAIERNEMSLYAGDDCSDFKMDVINCLLHIYDELGNEIPNDSYIQSDLETLEHLLRL